MKKIKLLVALALFGFAGYAQEVKFPAADSSPADLAYFPVNAAKAKAGDNTAPLIRVIYSRPAAKGRVVFGELVPYGKVWRAGANESTEIRFYQPAVIAGKTVAAGAYSLFVIPDKTTWTVILNRQTDRWGAYTYDAGKDVLRISVPVKTLDAPVESLSVVFSPETGGAMLHIAWDKSSAAVPITIK